MLYDEQWRLMEFDRDTGDFYEQGSGRFTGDFAFSCYWLYLLLAVIIDAVGWAPALFYSRASAWSLIQFGEAIPLNQMYNTLKSKKLPQKKIQKGFSIFLHSTE
jgi:hypothetical protein